METETRIYQYLSEGNINKVEELLSVVDMENDRLKVLSCLVEIYRAEMSDGVDTNIFNYSKNIDKLCRWYIVTKLYIRRLDFDMGVEYEQQFIDYCKENKVSVYMLARLVVHNVINKEKVTKKLIRMYIDYKGQQSDEVRYLAILLGKLKEIDSNRG